MREPLQLLFDYMGTPIATLLLGADIDGGVRAVDLADHDERMRRLMRVYFGGGSFGLKRVASEARGGFK
jgi:methylated-DNA-[protein]-cysteine S-methyltransferase